MHRSGTSSVAGSLTHLGATPPAALLPADWDNPRGFWESRPIIALDDRILLAGGSYWRDWRRFDAAFMHPKIASELQTEMSHTLAQEFGDASMIVLKEPRMCRLWNQWEPVLTAGGYEAGFVLPIRSPLEVAGSLHRRNSISMAEGLLLWLRHVLDAEKATRGQRRRILRWDRFMVDWRLETDRIEQALGWRLPDRGESASAIVDNFLSGSLRTVVAAPEDLSTGPDAHIWVSAVYQALTVLSEIDDDAGAYATLDDIGRQFDEASELFGRSVGKLLADVEAAVISRDRMAIDAERAEAVASRLGRNLLMAAEHKSDLQNSLTAANAALRVSLDFNETQQSAHTAFRAQQAAAMADIEAILAQEVSKRAVVEAALVQSTVDLADAKVEAADALAQAASVRQARDTLVKRLADLKMQTTTDRDDQAAVITGLKDAAARQAEVMALEITAHAEARRSAQVEHQAHATLLRQLEAHPLRLAGSAWLSRIRRRLSKAQRRIKALR